MANKKPFVANKNHFYIFIGIAMCLITVILCLNTGPVARYAAFPFVYAFGALSYVLFIVVAALGLRLIFAKKFIKIKLNIYFLATLILLVAGFMFFAHFQSMASLNQGEYLALSTNTELKTYNFRDWYNAYFDNRYFDFVERPILGLFYYPYASGIVGYFLVALFNNLFNVSFGALIVAIILAVVAVLLYFLPLILRAIGREKEPKTVQVKEEQEETISDISMNKKAPQKVRNIDVIKEASQIDPNTYESEITGTPRRSAAISSPTFIQQDSGANNFGINENGTFAPARFRIDNGQHNIQQEETIPEVQPAQEVQEPTKSEQMELDFNAVPEVNEELVQAKPVFEAPKMVAQPAQQAAPVQQPIQEQPQQVPVEEKPKPRERVKWIQPSTEVLNTYETSEQQALNERVANERKEAIDQTIQNFGVGAHVEDFTIGPSVTRFNIAYDRNVSARSVSNLVQDIQIRLGGVSARFESIVEGQSSSGLEIPNAAVTTVSFKDVYSDLPDVKKHPLAVAFGKNIKGETIFADFDEFPHILIAGTTGSGKSIFVNSIIVTLIMRNSPDDLKLVLVDPKKVEMSRYKDMPHLLCPIITDPNDAKTLIERLCKEMEERYMLFSDNGSTNIKEFNEDAPGLGLEKLPYIVVVLDEYADIVDQCKEISMPVVSLAQKARACGIHLLISTQRPSTNVVTGVIKANLPTHVALMTASSVDSMTIIGEGGAEKLIGKGDMLVQSPLVSRVGVVRLQGCFIHRTEISRVVGYLKEHYETHFDEKFLNLEEEATQAANDYMQTPEFKEHGNTEEERYQSIKEWVMSQEFMSISRIQRECGVGFNRAGRFFLRLQSEGVVGNETEGNKGCRVLVQDKFGSSNEESVATSDEQTYFRSDD